MTKKVTGNDLKNLIKEVLKEEQLNEKTYNIKGWKDKADNSFAPVDDSSISRVRGKNKVVKRGTTASAYKAAANSDSKPELTPADLPGAISILNPEVATDPSKYGGGPPVGGGIPGVKDPSALKKTGAGLMNATAVKKELKKITAAFKDLGSPPHTDAALSPIKVTAQKYQTAIAAQAGKTQGSVQKVFDKIAKDLGLIAAASAGNIRDAIKNLNQTLADVEAIFGTPVDDTNTFSSPQVDLPYHAISDDSWSRGKDIQANKLPNTTVQVILTELSRFNMDFTQMLDHYKQLGDNLVDARVGKTAGKTAIKDMPAEELFTSMSVMSTLDYITNSFQGSSAGPIYEVLQALLAGGVVFGGKQAGADVLMGNEGELWLSNKNSQLSGNASVSGKQSQKNIHALQVGETMWYIGFGKKGPAAKDQANKGRNTILRIFIVGINRVATADASASFNGVNADGTVVKKGLDAPGTDYSIPFHKVKSDTIDIPIRPLPSVNFSQLASEAIDKAKDTTQMAIRDIYVKLENIEKRTQTFLALHARQDATSEDKRKASNAASLAAGDYTNLKGDLKSGFGGVDTAAGAEFNEGKKITADFLKKLISESFKK